MVASKFKITAYLLPLFMVTMLITLIAIFADFKNTFTSTEAGIFVCTLLSFSLATLFFEMVTKAIAIDFYLDDIRIRPFMGFGVQKIYMTKELDGFHTSTITGKGGTYRTLYLVQGNKKVGKISEFYHSNYNVMHEFCSQNIQDLGFIKTNIVTEIKDIYK